MSASSTVRARLFTLLLCGGAGAAQGQSLDYGALEQLFGEPVTTSVTGSPQRAGDVPANMEIITAEEIRRSGASDIPGVLRHVVGVDFQQWTNNQADISVRGYDQAFSQRLLVLINGRQVYADYFSFTPWDTLPVELGEIRQIEVVKGPSTALFGFNAVGGVINIITYDALSDPVNGLSATGGTQDLAQGTGALTLKPNERMGLRIGAGIRRNEDFSTPVPPTMGAAPRQGNERQEWHLDGDVQLSDKAALRLEASQTRSDENLVQPGYQTEFTRFTTSSVKGQISADTHMGLLQATAYRNTIRQDDPPTEFLPLHFDNTVTVVNAQDIFKLGSDHVLRAAVEYRHDSAVTTAAQGGEVFYEVVSASGMWQWQSAPTVSLTNAWRVDRLALGRSGTTPPGYPFTNEDWNRRSLTEPSFNSSLVWKADGLDTLRLTVGRGVLLPNLNNLGGLVIFVPGGGGLAGNPALEPTVVSSIEAGWQRLVPALGAQWRVGLFQLRTTDVVTLHGALVRSGGLPYFVSSNIGNSRAAGLEMTLSGNAAEGWRWGFNYRYEKIHDDLVPFAQGGVTFTDYEHVTPTHLAKANLGWAHARWEFDSYIQYQSATSGLVPQAGGFGAPIGTLVPVAAYASLDGRVAYAWTPAFSLAVSGQNLTHSVQQQTSGASVERRVMGTFTYRLR